MKAFDGSRCLPSKDSLFYASGGTDDNAESDKLYLQKPSLPFGIWGLRRTYEYSGGSCAVGGSLSKLAVILSCLHPSIKFDVSYIVVVVFAVCT